jgi:hypothetical protein
MYRVIAKSAGKYGNVVLGARYCFRKKSAAQLIALFIGDECDFTVEKLTRISGDTFCWSNCNISRKIWDMAYNMLDKSKRE